MDEQIKATGHENVRAQHTSTLEVTTDDYLTPAGDCIVGVNADRAPATFDPAFIEACQDKDARITLTLATDEHRVHVQGRGDPALTFDSERSLVCRTSDYVDDRTVIVEAEMAAADLPRALVETLATGASLTVTLTVEPATNE